MGLEYKHIGWWRSSNMFGIFIPILGEDFHPIWRKARAKHPLEKREKHTSKVSNEIPQ